jgi:hypothetical protein
MENLLIASAAIVVAFFADFQCDAETFRHRRCKHSGF